MSLRLKAVSTKGGEGPGSCLDGSMPNACSECVVLFG